MLSENSHSRWIVPLFDSPVPRRLMWPSHAAWPRRRANALLRRFQAAFPEIIYDMDLNIELANAQAFLDGDLKRVRLYGGLCRHRRIGFAGLAVAIAHETGHHLGGAPYLEFYRWLSSEARATEWALTKGLPQTFGTASGTRIARQGLKELKAIGLAD